MFLCMRTQSRQNFVVVNRGSALVLGHKIQEFVRIISHVTSVLFCTTRVSYHCVDNKFVVE